MMLSAAVHFFPVGLSSQLQQTEDEYGRRSSSRHQSTMLKPSQNKLLCPVLNPHDSNGFSVQVVETLPPRLHTVIAPSALIAPSTWLCQMNLHVEALSWKCSICINAKLNLLLHAMKLLEKLDRSLGEDRILRQGEPIWVGTNMGYLCTWLLR